MKKINVEVANSLLSVDEFKDSYDRYDRLTGSCSDQEYFGTLVEVAKSFIGVGAPCLSSTWWPRNGTLPDKGVDYQLETNLETYLETTTKVSSSFQLITWMCQFGVLYQEDWIYGSETYDNRYNHIWEI
tara:strand:- start:1316 stop:1702 length:387 start_codon:yes stop_codon:yes gene_type:complete